jgi:dihydroflavonol-4-reductase
MSEESAKETILVTGGTGFLGRHLVKKLLTAGDVDSRPDVRVLTRGFDIELADLGVELIEGSLTEAQDVRRAIEGVTQVYHLAGRVERDPSRAHLMYDLHVEGTRHLLDALRDQPVKKIVVASTSGTVGVSKNPDFIARDESPHVEHVVAHWPYYLSKIYAERVCQRFVDDHEMPIVMMRPSLLLGPGDRKQSSTGDVILFMKKRIPATLNGGLSFVDVRDTAEAFIAAMEKGVVGRTYLLGGHNMTLEEFFQNLESITGIRAPWMPIPDEALSLGAKLLGGAMKTLGLKGDGVDPVSVEMARHYWYIDSARARQELGFTPRDAEETLRDTVRWLEQYHPDFVSSVSRNRREPPSEFVPAETIEYARKLRNEDWDAN